MSVPAPPTAPSAGTALGSGLGPGAGGRVVSTVHEPVTGDGTTFASRSRSRWRSARWPLVVLLSIVVVAVLAALSRPPVSSIPLAPDNPSPQGAQALARVLEDQGVRVDHVQRVSAAVSKAGPGTTLLVTSDVELLPEQVDVLVATGADLVLVAPDQYTLDSATGGAADVAYSWGGGDAVRPAGCTDVDAVAAEGIRSSGSGFVADSPDAMVCFPHPDEPGSGAYLVVQDGDRRVVALDDSRTLANQTIGQDGHAALALRALGHHEDLVWLVPDYRDFSTGADGVGTGIAALLPPWVGVVGLQLLVVTIAVALWRGRRLGPLVTEDLPVVVRASETTRGRGRLYRRARSRGHAAAGLRAACADRVAGRLGIPRSAAAPALVDAVVRATGRPADQVAHLLYGPPPADDAALLELARHLDQMESEVYHP
ncbi:DUF4350 domain-containing protein [Oerskovia flava]|uniref:DUF4350 domain-containing protein n=1 Tax=Oerskovia flava TaxID=2986422 RepID=UPI002240B0E3|nr:DUF4350 domain-containing protein [Oerskovia sp. JB1-3-2]